MLPGQFRDHWGPHLGQGFRLTVQSAMTLPFLQPIRRRQGKTKQASPLKDTSKNLHMDPEEECWEM